MSTRAFGYVNENLKEIKEKYNKSKKRMEEIKEARRQEIEENSKKSAMKNITINLPELYDEKIQELIKKKILPSRSEAIRTALREFLKQEYNHNLELLGFFD